MKLRIYVTLKTGVLDPQGEAVRQSLGGMGFAGIASLRQGKVFDLTLEGRDAASARAEAEAMAEQLLANLVIEDYRVEVL